MGLKAIPRNEALLERITSVIETECGGNVSAFAKKIGVNTGTLQAVISQGRMPNADILCKMAELLNINGHWLLTGQGSPTTEDIAPTSFKTLYEREVKHNTDLSKALAELTQKTDL